MVDAKLRHLCRSLLAATLTGTVAPAAVASDQLAGLEIDAYRLEVGGADNIHFRAKCRIIDDRNRDRYFTYVDDTPAQYDVSGYAVECKVRKLRGDGIFVVLLRRGDGVVIATSSTGDRKLEVRVRTTGPWGLGGARLLKATSAVPPRPPAVAYTRFMRFSISSFTTVGSASVRCRPGCYSRGRCGDADAGGDQMLTPMSNSSPSAAYHQA